MTVEARIIWHANIYRASYTIQLVMCSIGSLAIIRGNSWDEDFDGRRKMTESFHIVINLSRKSLHLAESHNVIWLSHDITAIFFLI